MRLVVGYRAAAGATHWFAASGFPALAFPFTLMFWGNQNVLTNAAGLSVNQESQTVLQNTAALGWTNAGLVQMQTYDSTSAGTADNLNSSGHTAMASNEWHHVAGVWNSATDRRSYLDGVRVSTAATSRVFTGLDQRRVSGRGNGTTSAGRWQGWACEHMVVQSNFTDAEMLAFYQNGTDHRVLGRKLLHYFPCSGLLSSQAGDLMSAVAFTGGGTAYTEPTVAGPRQFHHYSLNMAA